jgi:2-hydroxychromene-2-carboxylate isomerase
LEDGPAGAIFPTEREPTRRTLVKIPFYFDYACPWAYLGSSRVESYFADLGVEIDFLPVRLAKIVEIAGPRGLPSGDRKRRWYISDLHGWAELSGAELAPLGADAPRPDI